MGLRFRRDRLPGDARAQLRLQPGEHVRAWARAADGQHLVATEAALHLPGEPGRLPWERLDRVVWRDGALRLQEAPATDGTAGAGNPPAAGSAVGRVGRRHDFRLVQPGGLPAEVRARVEASIAYSHYERLGAAGGVRVVGRRQPGSARLSWSVSYDAAVDQLDPQVRAQVEQLVRAARDAVGE